MALQDLLKKKFNKFKSFSELQQNFSQIYQKSNQSVKDIIAPIDQAENEYLNIDDTADVQLLDLRKKIKLTFRSASLSLLRSPNDFDAATQAAINKKIH